MKNIEVIKSSLSDKLYLTIRHKIHPSVHFDSLFSSRIRELMYEHLTRNKNLDLHLNCESVDYIDSFGICVLLSIACTLKESDNHLQLCKVNTRMRKTLELMKVSDLIQICYKCYEVKECV